MGEPLSPDRVFDFLKDELEPHPAYDFFTPASLPGYAGNPNNNNGWLEADDYLLGEFEAMVDEQMVVPAIEEMDVLMIDMEEDLAVLFDDDDFEDDAFDGFGEEEVGGPSTAVAEGPSFPHLDSGLPVPPFVIEDLSTRLSNLDYGKGQLVQGINQVSDAEVAASVTIGELGPRIYVVEGHCWEIRTFTTYTSNNNNTDGISTSIIPGPVTTEEKAQKTNDVKARSMLLVALPNEHLLTFSQYKDAKTLFEAIQARFGRNDATKKTQKTLLKQMYENFNAPITESLDSIFNKLQKIISQLAILGEKISQEDLNMKFLRSLPSEWNTHVVVWRNKANLDTMSIDDIYNNFKIVEQEVKRMVTSSSSSGSQNMAFFSSHGSTNEVDTTNLQVSTVSTPVSTVSSHDNTANLSDATVYAFLATQPNGSQLVHEDLEQIHKDDLEEMDLKWQLALLSMRARGYFQRTEDTSSKAMVAIDRAGFDWSYMADYEVPTNMALMAFSDPKKALDAPIIEDWVFDSDEDESKEIVLKSDNVQHKPEQANQPRKMVQKLVLKNVEKETSQREVRPVWNNAMRTNHQNFSNSRRNFALMTVLTKSRIVPISTARQSSSRAATPEIYPTSLTLRSMMEGMLPLGEEIKVVRLLEKAQSKLLADESQVLLKVPRKNNMYSFDMKNIVPQKELTCLLVKATNDESMLWIFKSFITEIENLVEKKVKIIRCDNKTEFKNRVMNEFYEEKDSKLPTTFWAKAVNTACYVQNRVLVVKPHFKTPYELFKGRSPALSFMRPFGCHITILNTLDQLGKFDGKSDEGIFDGKSDEGIFVGYSIISIAFRVNNTNTRKVEKNLHITFLENKPMIAGGGPEWLFDIDALSKSMNYALVPVVNTATPTNADYLSDPLMSDLEDTGIFNDAYDDRDEGAEADYNNLETVISVSPIPSTRIHKDYPKEQIIGEVKSAVQTRKMAKQNEAGKRAIGTKWVYRNKRDQQGIVVRNKARLVAQGHRQEEGIDYDEVLAPVAQIEAISDYAGASLDRKSTIGGYQFLGSRLISWQCKKQTIVANSTTKADYIDASNCCGHVLWLQNQLLDYGYNFIQTKIHVDNESAICVVKNHVYHSKTKHIEIRHHFIRDSYAKRLIEMISSTQQMVINSPCLTDKKELAIPGETTTGCPSRGGDSVEMAITTDASLEAAHASDNILTTHTTAMPNVDIPQGMDTEGYTSRSGEGRMEHTIELMDIVPPTPHDSPLIGGYTPRSDEETLLNIKRSTSKDKGKGIMQETELPKKIKKREMIQLSLNEELTQKLYAEELAKETARQEQEKYDLEKALELQR
nr:putative ribonuclease H-like domain-containing protein [Tanacetum cinerariifolium]